MPKKVKEIRIRTVIGIRIHGYWLLNGFLFHRYPQQQHHDHHHPPNTITVSSSAAEASNS